MIEKSLSSSSGFQVAFTEIKCMLRVMCVAITRRGVWGAKSENRVGNRSPVFRV